jgi:2-keto-3-deoxy-L-fuconate dehydrogenase
MAGRLQGKRAFVTAASAGIGRACALAFAREGARVVATDVDENAFPDLQRAGIAETFRLDVCDTAAVNEAARRVGTIDVLLNAAGFVHHGTVLDCSDDDWDFSFDLNVKSMHRTIRAFLPGMLDGGGGSIVNISSAAGVLKAAPNRYVYGATKAAVAALTRAVAADFITRGIRCNCICPGTINTPILAGVMPSALENFKDQHIIRRLGEPEDIAAAVAYFFSDDASFLTGEILPVDGGWNTKGSAGQPALEVSTTA